MFVRVLFAFISIIIIYFISYDLESVDQQSLLILFIYFNLFFDFLLKLGSQIPIKQLILLIAITQWGVAPFLSYHFYTESVFYYMQVEESIYMNYMFPSILLFLIGLFLPIYRGKIENFSAKIQLASENNSTLLKRGKFLFYTGLFSIVLQPFVPPIIGFVFFLLSKLSFVGAFYLFALKAPNRMIYMFIAFLPIIYSAIQSSVFHDMFLWGGFFFIIYTLIRNSKMLQKLSLIGAGILVFLFVQLIKEEYRGEISESNVDRTDVLIEVASKKINQDVEEDFFQATVDRLNQGWIIARILHVVPTYEPYAEGETIKNGIAGALLPRFLLPNKAVSGGYYFERFTGIELKGTSMNLGIVGEAYANYGGMGGAIFMFFFGLFINISLVIIYKSASRKIEFYFWIPFLFLYMVKAEDDFITMFNQFTKAVYMTLLMAWIMNKFFPYPIEEGEEESESEQLLKIE